MEPLRALRRLIAGPDRRQPPAGWRLPAAFRLYGTPLGLLVLLMLGLANGAYLMDTRSLRPWPAALLSIGVVLPVVLSAAGLRLTAWRLAWPMLFIGVARATPEEPWPWTPVQILAFLAVFVLLTMRERASVIAWTTALSIVPILALAPRTNAWGVAVLLIALALAGDLVSRRRRARAQLDEQTRLTEREQDRRAVLEERTRIAREMHDVVAHHMSMIAVQAETAPYRVPGVPDPARAEFQDIAAAAREALTEMRRLLGVLRAEPDRAPLTPQPTLADVPALIAGAARAGMPVTCPQPGPPPSHVPAATGLAAYRIIQEALANAARHAPGSPTTVAIRATPAALLLEIANGPTPTTAHPETSRRTASTAALPAEAPATPHHLTPPHTDPSHTDPSTLNPPPTHPPPGLHKQQPDSDVAPVQQSPQDGKSLPLAGRPLVPGSPQSDVDPSPVEGGSSRGHGLDGMRERALALGGTLDVGRQPDGGCLVAARLPLTSEPPAEARSGSRALPGEGSSSAESLPVGRSRPVESFAEKAVRSGEDT
ncbi:sensor histidine kinase [Symbioplanes lichenis]|uniref:sensor histidine kinase n=1 Tax=Symbioplanes lichenis TaxID=1629072 RepID=UPI0027383136|nr:histidine kinase [Actinoplanes lichenis]